MYPTPWGNTLDFTIDANIIEESTFQGLGMPAEFGEATGAVMTAVTKSGSNKLSGLVDFRYNGDGWNSQNLGRFAESEFLNPSTKYIKVKVGNFRDISGQIGGKIIQDKLWFFLSGGYTYSKIKALNAWIPTKTFTPSLFAKLTYQLNRSNKFNVSFKYSNDRKDDYMFWEDIGLNEYRPDYLPAASWTSIFSSKTYLDVKAGINLQKYDQLPIGGMDTPGSEDLLTGAYIDNMGSWMKTTGRTFHVSAHLSHYVPFFITGSHDITIGAETQRSYDKFAYGYPGGVKYYLLGGEPYLMVTNPTGTNMDYFLGQIIGFVQDTWSLTKRLTLNIGFRYDNFYFKIPHKAAATSTAYKNDALAPRLGLTYDLFGDRKNIFKLYYGHLVDGINCFQFFDLDNRAFGDNYYQWTDNAWVLFQAAPTGEAPPRTTLDPKVKHPYIKELSAAYERELFKDASLTINAYYKTLGAAMGPINTTAQWETITITNPGLDGVVGTSDDLGPLDVYMKTTSYEDDRFLITNPVAGQSPCVLETPWKKMRGIEFIFNKRYSKGWQLLASYHYTKCTGNTDSASVYIVDPNQFVNSKGQMVYYYGQPHQFKFQGSVLLPLNIMMGVTAQYISGHPVSGYFYTTVNGVMTQVQGLQWGQKKCGSNKDVSVKFEKRFPIKGVQLTGYVDLYNVFNFASTPYSWNRSYLFGPNYGKLRSVQDPRSFRVGARFVF